MKMVNVVERRRGRVWKENRDGDDRRELGKRRRKKEEKMCRRKETGDKSRSHGGRDTEDHKSRGKGSFQSSLPPPFPTPALPSLPLHPMNSPSFHPSLLYPLSPPQHSWQAVEDFNRLESWNGFKTRFFFILSWRQPRRSGVTEAVAKWFCLRASHWVTRRVARNRETFLGW